MHLKMSFVELNPFCPGEMSQFGTGRVLIPKEIFVVTLYRRTSQGMCYSDFHQWHDWKLIFLSKSFLCLLATSIGFDRATVILCMYLLVLAAVASGKVISYWYRVHIMYTFMCCPSVVIFYQGCIFWYEVSKHLTFPLSKPIQYWMLFKIVKYLLS